MAPDFSSAWDLSAGSVSVLARSFVGRRWASLAPLLFPLCGAGASEGVFGAGMPQCAGSPLSQGGKGGMAGIAQEAQHPCLGHLCLLSAQALTQL